MSTEMTDPASHPMHTAPQDEHRWLQRLVGAWTYQAEMLMGPDTPPVVAKGTETVRAFGDLWIIAEGEGEMPGGGTARSILSLTFNPKTGRFVGSWIGSPMAHLWVYDGALEPDGKTLPLLSQGPSMSGDGGMATYKDVIEILSDDHRTLSGYGQGPDGSWQRFMRTEYRRVK